MFILNMYKVILLTPGNRNLNPLNGLEFNEIVYLMDFILNWVNRRLSLIAICYVKVHWLLYEIFDTRNIYSTEEFPLSIKFHTKIYVHVS